VHLLFKPNACIKNVRHRELSGPQEYQVFVGPLRGSPCLYDLFGVDPTNVLRVPCAAIHWPEAERRRKEWCPQRHVWDGHDGLRAPVPESVSG